MEREPHLNLELLRRLEPLGRALERYFHSDVRGLEHIPEGAALFVGNHSGGVVTPDSYLFGLAFYRHTGWKEPLLALAHDALYYVPVVAEVLRFLGGIPASQANAERYLGEGHKVLVYPGGDWETHRPSWERDRIDFGGRRGFVELALRTGVPVVPVVSAGAHDGWYVMTRGEDLAKKLKLDEIFRIRVFPIALGLPTGLVLGPASVHLPPPGHILIEVLEPVHLEGDADDPEAVEAGYQAVTERMQAALGRLAAERRRSRARR